MFYTICLLSSSQELFPTGFHYHTLQGFTKVMPSKGTQTIWKASEWNEELESNVWSKRPPESSAKHDNKVNLYAADSPTVQPLDFTVPSQAEAVPVQHEETTETSIKVRTNKRCLVLLILEIRISAMLHSWLSQPYSFRKASFSKCFLSTPKVGVFKFLRFEEGFQKSPVLLTG